MHSKYIKKIKAYLFMPILALTLLITAYLPAIKVYALSYPYAKATSRVCVAYAADGNKAVASYVWFDINGSSDGKQFTVSAAQIVNNSPYITVNSVSGDGSYLKTGTKPDGSETSSACVAKVKVNITQRMCTNVDSWERNPTYGDRFSNKRYTTHNTAEDMNGISANWPTGKAYERALGTRTYDSYFQINMNTNGTILWMNVRDDHVAQASLVANATCTTAPIYHNYCNVCGGSMSGDYYSGNALGHAWGNNYESSRTNATCTTNGTIYYSHKCSRCNTVESNGTSNINALGHNWQTATTSVNNGVRTNATCTDAATYYQKCSRCTAKDTSKYNSVGERLKHIWNDGVISTAPTVYSTGIRTFTCQRDHNHIVNSTEPRLQFRVFIGNKRISLNSLSSKVYSVYRGNTLLTEPSGTASKPEA